MGCSGHGPPCGCRENHTSIQLATRTEAAIQKQTLVALWSLNPQHQTLNPNRKPRHRSKSRRTSQPPTTARDPSILPSTRCHQHVEHTAQSARDSQMTGSDDWPMRGGGGSASWRGARGCYVDQKIMETRRAGEIDELMRESVGGVCCRAAAAWRGGRRGEYFVERTKPVPVVRHSTRHKMATGAPRGSPS